MEDNRLNPLIQKSIAWGAIALALYVLLVAVGVVGKGFRQVFGGADGIESLFVLASNPFIGLVFGILATALIQSSSTVTAIIVGLVAGGLPISVAIPMVMGANVGTTVTNTIVSFGHMNRPSEFKKAFATATVHDFFNLLCIVIFLPLELAFGFIEKLSYSVTGILESIGTVDASGIEHFQDCSGFRCGFCEIHVDWIARRMGWSHSHYHWSRTHSRIHNASRKSAEGCVRRESSELSAGLL